MDSEQPIGYFDPRPNVGLFVLCSACLQTVLHGESNVPTRIYRENIRPYKQTCHNCNEVLVEGRSDAWPELFSKEEQINGNITTR